MLQIVYFIYSFSIANNNKGDIMKVKEKIILSITKDKLEEFKDFGDTLDLSRNKAIVYLASIKLNELNETKREAL